MKEAEMSKDAEKGLNGKACAQNFLNGNLQHPEDDYGAIAPNGSLINGPKTKDTKVIKEESL